MSARTKFYELLMAVCDAEFDCGEHTQERTESYDSVRERAFKSERELRDFVEPYLPKD